MAKAKAKCKCEYCGAEFVREKTCRNRSEAESWESWAVDKLRECPKCYGDRRKKEEAEKPFTISVSVGIYPPQILLTASGNTREHKEELKSAGYHWDYVEEGGLLGFLSMTPKKAWQRTIPLEDKNLDSEEFKEFLAKAFEQIDKLGAIGKATYTQTDLILCGQQLAELQKEKSEEQAAIDQLKLKKPKLPDWVPEGRWNRKIYGSARSGFSIYVDSNKISISDEQKTELSAWIAATEKFEKELEKIKNS